MFIIPFRIGVVVLPDRRTREMRSVNISCAHDGRIRVELGLGPQRAQRTNGANVTAFLQELERSGGQSPGESGAPHVAQRPNPNF